MKSVRSSVLWALAAIAAVLSPGCNSSPDLGITPGTSSLTAAQSTTDETQKTAYERRKEANARLQEAKKGRPDLPTPRVLPSEAASAATMKGTPTGINPAVDINLPNFANSPNLRKFVDSLPGLGAANANTLGNYIPIAVPDNTTYPGSDYYEIGLVEYHQRMHSDLPTPGTKLRGYVQLNGGDPNPHYLGPIILATKDRPIRLKFVNMLPTGAGGNLFLPVDTTIMGAGMGPLGMAASPMNYTQNRADLHLHGGLPPWISDGTPHQWITPAAEVTSYPRGALAVNVPDMPDPGPGAMTYYWTNAQSARLMFYHDHAYGITRLNVYAGEAAGFLLSDQVEEDLVTGSNVSGGNPAATPILPNLGGVYKYGIPLVIQDRTFLNDNTTSPGAGFPTTYTPTAKTAAVDPLWYTYVSGTAGGDLWLPHEYLPNENIYDNANGFNAMGRWDYGPWMLPPMVVKNNTLPSPTLIPEAFMDTPVVNGQAYPYVELPPTAIRFRILNACNDRFLNLQLYKADPTVYVNVTNGGTGYTAPVVTLAGGGGTYTSATATVDATGVITGVSVTGAAGYTSAPAVTITDNGTGTGAQAVAFVNTEVKMVPASPNAAFPTWPRDGRDGGVPDPTTKGPDMIQIGNECGFLAAVNVIPAQPVDFDYNRRSVTFGGVTSKALFLPPAVRADIVVDLSAYKDGDTLILYNDAGAPVPLYDSRNDYYTDDPDQTAIGGAPSTPAGFGPNTRTIMQIRIKGTPTAAYNLAALQTALPKAFAVGQESILVNESAYNQAYNANWGNNFVNVADFTLNTSGAPQPVGSILTDLPGFGYTTPPTVNIYGGGGTGATAVASLNGVAGITLVTAGTGYLVPPTVTITAAPGDLGTGATATATISGGSVTAITVINLGSNYLVAPTVTITAAPGDPGTGATATANVTLGSVGAITLTNPGSGYTKAPYVYLTGGGGTGATAAARLVNDMTWDGKNLVEGMDMEFGRMNAVLGSTPNPLTPTVGAGPVVGMAYYIDPPTEIVQPDQTLLWRISHIGVDSHALHFHLFNVQVINRVDWTNTLKAPYPEEVGWKETIRTNPFEDIIVAMKPKVSAMKLPFGLPDANRLLDVTMPAGSTAGFSPAAPPPGIPAVAQITNVMTNFHWEYVWHCHLLGHEENDMMRPLVFNVPSTIPAASTLSATATNGQVNLTWTDPTPFNYATGLPVSTLGNPANEVGFIVQRATGTTGAFAQIGTALANATTFADATVTAGTTYRYRVYSYNAAGNSPFSNALTVQIIAPPAAPTNAVATVNTAQQITLTWTDNANNETGFTVERSDNGSAFVQIAAPARRNGTGGTVTYVDATVTGGTTYTYQVAAVNAGGKSAYAVSNTVVTPIPPAAPTNLAATAARANGNRDTVTLTWTNNATGVTSLTLQRATNAAFTAGLNSSTVAGTATTTTQTGMARARTYWYRIQAVTASGPSAWSNVVSVTTP